MNQNSYKVSITKITDHSNLSDCLSVISNSFLTVAKDYNITKDNCPSYAAFRTINDLDNMLNSGIDFYGLYENNKQAGFVCMKKNDDNTYILGLLSVLPENRHKGYGKALIDYIFNEVKILGGHKVVIWLMNENDILKKWYINYGFSETNIRKSEGMPFSICDMEKVIDY
ncbi:hypothetical protein SDC9_107798 [bioreactor metagenome]|uniref:N-acetyltransferase domain-containing protein n=1 Tax=bioreactor metagenome TaxID=1076179 RepID=A0A645BGR2_9ZZZZ|nr:GNAT family N-acetyltransferase [Oscillospiraceae bacterium]